MQRSFSRALVVSQNVARDIPTRGISNSQVETKTQQKTGWKETPGMFVPKSEEPTTVDIQALRNVLDHSKNLLVITGAGISTESGIPDYRSVDVGRFSRSKHRPVQYQEFIKSPTIRQRYWARNFVGWPWFRDKKPNESHSAISQWESDGMLNWLITQNVDRLHQKAGSKDVSELHGNSFEVKCLNCKEEYSRDGFIQEYIRSINPGWEAEATDVAPDGDVDLSDDQIASFKTPHCPTCKTGILQPKVVFFGDSVPKDLVEFLYHKVDTSDALLVVGSTLQTYSAFRFVRRASERKLPIAILNVGPTRGDPMATLKIDAKIGNVSDAETVHHQWMPGIVDIVPTKRKGNPEPTLFVF